MGISDWPMYRGPDLNGYNPNTIAIRNSLSREWYETFSKSTTGAIIYNGSIFVVYGDGYEGTIEAFDLDTGISEWSNSIQTGVHTPAAVDGKVIAADDSGGGTSGDDARVIAFDADTGTQVWESTVSEGAFSNPPKIYGSGVCVEVYEADSDTYDTYEVDSTDGSVSFSYCSSYSDSNPAIVNDWTYEIQDSALVASETGSEKWRFEPSGNLSSPTVADGLVFVGISGTSNNNGIVALDRTTGDVNWKYSTSFEIGHEVIVAGGEVYASFAWPDGGVLKVTGESDVSLVLQSDSTQLHIGDSVQFSVTRNDTGEAVDATITVDNTTLETGSDGTVEYTFNSSGNYTAIAEKSIFLSDSVSISVEENVSPSPSFSFSPKRPPKNKSVTFDASVSSDSDGSIAGYEWDFNNDGTIDATGEITTHSFSSSGDYNVTLTVTDDDGATNSTSSVVSVTEELLVEKWTKSISGHTQYSKPVVNTDLVFIGGLDSTFYALYATTGSVIWEHERNGSLSDSSPVLNNSRVIVGSGGGILYALNTSDGSVDWKHETNSAIVSSPTVSNGMVWAGTNDGRVLAIDATDGSTVWSKNVGEPIYSTVRMAGGQVYVTTDEGSLIALYDGNGAELWKFNTQTKLGHSSPQIKNGTVYLAADKIYAINPSDGTVNWESSYGGTVGSSPTIADGTLYVGSATNTISAIDISDGTSIWTYETNGPVGSTPAVTGNRVVAGSDDGNVYALDTETGQELGKASVGSPVWSSPVISSNIVYIGSQDGSISGLENI